MEHDRIDYRTAAAMLRAGLVSALAFALVFALAGCGASSEGRRDRIAAAVEEGCPVQVPGTSVQVKYNPRDVVYLFDADDDAHRDDLRRAVRALADRYEAYAREHGGLLPPQYSPSPADDVGDERDWDKLPLLPHVQASSETTASGAQMTLSVPDPDLVDELREHVKSDLERLQSGVCAYPDELGERGDRRHWQGETQETEH
jgi:hypothetical protein